MSRALLALFVVLPLGPPAASASPEAAWRALGEGGAVALVRAEAEPRAAALRETVRAWAGTGTLVLVTRQATITAVTGIVTIVGRIP